MLLTKTLVYRLRALQPLTHYKWIEFFEKLPFTHIKQYRKRIYTLYINHLSKSAVRFYDRFMSAMSQDISIVKFHIVFQTALVFTNKEFNNRADTITAWEIQSLKWNMQISVLVFTWVRNLISLSEKCYLQNIWINLNRQVRKATCFTNKSFTVFEVLPNVVEQWK